MGIHYVHSAVDDDSRLARSEIHPPMRPAGARPKGTRRHTYDLPRYGLSRADVESAFGAYNALRAEVDRAREGRGPTSALVSDQPLLMVRLFVWKSSPPDDEVIS
ncbi:hypothetical protein [Streptomyces sp. NPDC006551]|uniref:hypothetical protein n=1 Tax=Streptomyces sp. NPDC006551 TaxID=3157178 RepID=UPI0033B0BCE2